MQLVQEEWQTSCSGEVGSYAVKQEAPLVCKCEAQHLWVGNGFPECWKNDMGQVSRRLAGVHMMRKVQPRDGRIFKVIEQHVASFQRCTVLAYFEFNNQYGSLDPMSTPDKLPPAFREYYFRGTRLSNPVVAFVSSNEHVVYDEKGFIEFKELKDLFTAYCVSNNVNPKKRNLTREHPFFIDNGLTVQKSAEPQMLDGVPLPPNTWVVLGLRER